MKEGRLSTEPALNSFCRKPLSVLERRLVRYGEFLATLCAARSQHLATISRSHTSAETVLVDTLATRRLVCSLHCHSYIVFIVLAVFTDCKSTTKKLSAKVFRENISENRVKSPKFCLLRGQGRGRNDPFRNRNVLPDRPQFCFASSRLFTTFGLVTIL